ncbi:ferredoxin--NADP+ reductase [Oceanospirillum multiglobuliferum]|nr:FAD-dependent oxidoreductase [Oceanospirillum multiglobuliferum]SKA20423.1 ferredoxin--NADP+ reductase [Oceanospirillum multiglobuliferum]
MTTSIAIVGSGPSGFYLADLLSKKIENSQVDLIDRLPSMFGLVRAGVAPDHIGTKNISRQFERTLQKDNVRFLGNVEIGRDVSYDELKSIYDIVIITIGALEDRELGIEGSDLDAVYGSGRFVAWYNGHPDHRDLNPKLDGKSIAIIGNGNVSLDIARILAKTPEEMVGSDISQHAQDAIAASTVEDIYLIGRRGPIEASFTPPELGEFAEMTRCVPLVQNIEVPAEVGEGYDPRDAKARQRNLEILQEYAANTPEQKPVRLHFLFWHSPKAITGNNGRISNLILENSAGESVNLPVDTLFSAIGYRSKAIPGMPFDEQRGIVANDNGFVESGVYTSGWCKRGPNGVIPANRADSMDVAKRIIADLEATPIVEHKAGSHAMDQLLNERNIRVVNNEDWQRISQAEVDRAPEGKPREKFTSIAEMLAVLG